MLPKQSEREQIPLQFGNKQNLDKEERNLGINEQNLDKKEHNGGGLIKEDELPLKTADYEDAEVVMEKSRAGLLIAKSKVNYNAVIKTVCNMYDGIFSKDVNFSYSRKDLLEDYDSYLQAILIKLCYQNDKFTVDEMKFVENVADYGKLVDGADFNLFADCAKEMKDVVFEKAEARLKDVPVCFKLAVAIDKSKNLGVLKSMLDSTVKIAFNLKLIDENANLKDNTDVINALKTVYVFAKSNGISVR